MKKSLSLLLLSLLSPTSFVLAMPEVDSREGCSSAIRRDEPSAEALAERKRNPLYAPELLNMVLRFLPPHDQKALAATSRFHHDVVNDRAKIAHRHITEELDQLTPVDQAFIRAIFGRSVDCQAHPHFDILTFIDYFKRAPKQYQTLRTRLGDDEFILRARVLGTHAPLLLPAGIEPHWHRTIVTQALGLPTKEIIARVTALATHAPLLLPAGIESRWHAAIVLRALKLFTEELTQRAEAIAAHAALLLPEDMSPEWRAAIRFQVLDLPAEELTARAMALAPLLLPEDKNPEWRAGIIFDALGLAAEQISTRAQIFHTSPHLTEQNDPYVRCVIIENILQVGGDSPLVQRGLDTALNESLAGTHYEERQLSLSFLRHPNSLFDRVKDACEQRIIHETPYGKAVLLHDIERGLRGVRGSQQLLQEFKQLGSRGSG